MYQGLTIKVIFNYINIYIYIYILELNEFLVKLVDNTISELEKYGCVEV